MEPGWHARLSIIVGMILQLVLLISVFTHYLVSSNTYTLLSLAHIWIDSSSYWLILCLHVALHVRFILGVCPYDDVHRKEKEGWKMWFMDRIRSHNLIGTKGCHSAESVHLSPCSVCDHHIVGERMIKPSRLSILRELCQHSWWHRRAQNDCNRLPFWNSKTPKVLFFFFFFWIQGKALFSP